MTTPQNELHLLGERIRYLTDLFETDEDDSNIFETIRQVELNQRDLAESHKKLADQMNLIIKLLSK